MLVNKDPAEVIAALAVRQDGAFTAANALRAGYTRKQIRTRRDAKIWIEQHRDVLRFAATPVTPRLRLRAALLFAGSDALLARRSAGEWWNLDGVRVLPNPRCCFRTCSTEPISDS